MNVAAPLPAGLRTSDPWPANGVPVEYRPIRSADVVSRIAGTAPFVGGQPGGARAGHYWAVNPYAGCEFACTYCHARELPPFRDADFRTFERNIQVRVNAREEVLKLLQDGAHRGVPLVLGTTTDPWQPTEKKVNVTRSVLQELAQHDGIDLRAQTRSAVAGRDADLLGQIARRGHAAVSFSIGSLDRRFCRTLEPLAPSPDLRFIAMETLARAGVRVGLVASPILPGLNDSLIALQNLARRARNCGASFAVASPLVMPAPARERVVKHVARFDPELATRYDRLLARTVDDERGFRGRLQERFREACENVGLPAWSEPEPNEERVEVEAPTASRRRHTPSAVQLSLW